MSITVHKIYSYLSDGYGIHGSDKYIKQVAEKSRKESKFKNSSELILGSGSYCLSCGQLSNNPILNYQFICVNCNSSNCLFICPYCLVVFSFLETSTVICPGCRKIHQTAVCTKCHRINLLYSKRQKCSSCENDLSDYSIVQSKSISYLLSAQIAIFLLLIHKWPKVFNSQAFIEEYYHLIGDHDFVFRCIEKNWPYFLLSETSDEIGRGIATLLEQNDIVILLHQTTSILSRFSLLSNEVVSFLETIFFLCGISKQMFDSFLGEYFFTLTEESIDCVNIPTELKRYYYVLNLHFSATKTELKKKFRDCAKKYHPDIYSGDDQMEKKANELKFISCKEAYDILDQFIKD